MGKIIKNGISYSSAGSSGGSDIQVLTQEEYDALVTAGTVDENIYYFIGDEDENGEAGDNIPAFYIGYDNSTSGLTATDIQGAVDEVNTDVVELNTKVGTMQSTVDGISGDVTELNQKCTNLETSFQDGCSTIAAAITSKGVSTASNASPATMAANIGSIKSGATIVNLGTARSINVSSYEGYKNFTAANFFPVCASSHNATGNVGNDGWNGNVKARAYFTGVSVSYNASTGVVTISGGTYKGGLLRGDYFSTPDNLWFETSGTVTVTTYLVY